MVVEGHFGGGVRGAMGSGGWSVLFGWLPGSREPGLIFYFLIVTSDSGLLRIQR